MRRNAQNRGCAGGTLGATWQGMARITKTRTENGTAQFCRGALERGLATHTIHTYTTLHYLDDRRERRFHFCDDHPPADDFDGAPVGGFHS